MAMADRGPRGFYLNPVCRIYRNVGGAERKFQKLAFRERRQSYAAAENLSLISGNMGVRAPSCGKPSCGYYLFSALPRD